MVNAAKIWVKGELLDMVPGSLLNIESASSLFENEILRGEYSYPFTLPLTIKNRQLLGFVEETHALTETKKIAVQYERLLTITYAMLFIDSVDFDFNTNQGTVSCSLVGMEGYFYALIQNKKLENFTFGGSFYIPAYPAIPALNIQSSAIRWASDIANGVITGMPFCFPMIKWDNFGLANYDYDICNGYINYYTEWPNLSGMVGKQYDFVYYPKPPLTGTHLQRMVPMFYLWWVIRQLFAEVGFSITGDLMNDRNFKSLYVLNNYSINKWSENDDNPYLLFNDTCNQINPNNHMPDMLATEFLNAICQVFNVQFIPSGLTSFEIKTKKSIVNTTTVLELDKTVISSFVSKKITDTVPAQNGINLQYTDGDDIYSTFTVTDKSFTTLTGTVASYGSLLGITALNGEVYYVTADAQYYQYNLSVGQWQIYAGLIVKGEYTGFVELNPLIPTMLDGDIYYLTSLNELVQYNIAGSFTRYSRNFVALKQYPGGIDLNLQGTPLVNMDLTFDQVNIARGDTWYNIAVDLPHIAAPGRWHANEYVLPTLVVPALQTPDSPKNTIGLHLMFYYGLQNVPVFLGTSGSPFYVPQYSDYHLPYSSGFNYCFYATPTVISGVPHYPKVFDWNLCLYGTDGIYVNFYKDWDKALLNSVKYVLQVYLPEFAVGTLDFNSKILALQQIFLLYKKTFNLPYQNTASLELYIIKAPSTISSPADDVYMDGDYSDGGYTDAVRNHNEKLLPPGNNDEGYVDADYVEDDYV